jgi:hypothetical protein
MVISYRQIDKIQFPVYVLPSSNWELVDGLLYVDQLLVDDKNMPGDTIGKRRLQTPFKNLQPLKRAADNLLAIIKSGHKCFIDTNGVPFIYDKTESCALKYHKIRKVERKDTASVLWLKDFNFPFVVPRPPPTDYTWAGVLHLKGLPWVLYEYSVSKKADTRRKI